MLEGIASFIVCSSPVRSGRLLPRFWMTSALLLVKDAKACAVA
jgi:hypothetical protein